MAKNCTISNAAAKAGCDAITALLNGGTLKIYDGAQPANPDVAISTQTLLATLALSATAFGAAADANPGGRATANAITADAAADATGTASWGRGLSSAAAGVIDGSCGTADADYVFDTVAFVAGAEISMSSWTVTMPES